MISLGAAKRLREKRLLDIVDRLPCDQEGRTVLWGDYVEDDQGQRWRVHAIRAHGMIEVDNEKGSRFWWSAAAHYRKVEDCNSQPPRGE